MKISKKERSPRKSPFFVLIAVFLSVLYQGAQGQTPWRQVTLDSCLYHGNKNFPLLRQKWLLEESGQYQVDNIHRMLWPQISVQGQATLQSEVTGIPITLPNVEIPVLSKDQYRIYGEVNQSITDFFTVDDAVDGARQQLKIDQEKWNLESFKWEEKIMDLFFQIALLQSQETQLDIMKKDIEVGMKKMINAVENGIATESSLDQLRAELIKADQKSIEIAHAKTGLMSAMSVWIGKPIASDANWVLPANITSSSTATRPEIRILEEQQKMTDIQWGITHNKKLPRLGAYVQLGAGRPGLNMLSNNFDTYWIGGLRLQWNLSTWYTLGREKKILQVQRNLLDAQKDNISRQFEASEVMLRAEKDRYLALVAKDNEFLDLRLKIQNTAATQLEEGIATANDFLNYVNQTDLARQNLATHQLQLLKLEYQNLYLSGHRFNANQ